MAKDSDCSYVSTLMEVCGLEMPPRALCTPEDKPQLLGVISLNTKLQQLSQHSKKTHTVSFTGLINNNIARGEKLYDLLKLSNLDPTELTQVATPSLQQVEDIMDMTTLMDVCSPIEHKISQLYDDVENVKTLKSIAASDGNHQEVKRQLYVQAALLEQITSLLEEKRVGICKVEDNNEQFRRIYQLQKAAILELHKFKDTQMSRKETCEKDLKRIRDATWQQEYQQFIDVASQHEQALELTVHNCEVSIEANNIISEIVAESCTAVKARYDRLNQEICDFRLLVDQEHLGVFRKLHSTLSRLITKAERQLRDIDKAVRTCAAHEESQPGLMA